MAGRPLKRERERLAAEAKKNAGIGALADEAVLAAANCGQFAEAPAAETKPSSSEDKRAFVVDSMALSSILSDRCSPDEMKIALSTPDPSLPSSAVEHIVACQRVIALLLEDTEEKISSVESLNAAEMTLRVTQYFEECDRRKRSYTVPGLAYAIGFINRRQLATFVSDKYETLSGYLVARALMRIEEQRNVEILAGNGMMMGHKLDLATNFEWNDAKQKSSKDEEKPTSITQNIINYNSLPPVSMSVDEWQHRFLEQQKDKEKALNVIDVAPPVKEKK